jgi:hypothetical protein
VAGRRRPPWSSPASTATARAVRSRAAAAGGGACCSRQVAALANTEASAIWTEIHLCGVCSCHGMVRASQPRCGSAEILLRFGELSGWRARLAAGDVVFFTAATVVVQVLRPRLRILIIS